VNHEVLERRILTCDEETLGGALSHYKEKAGIRTRRIHDEQLPILWILSGGEVPQGGCDFGIHAGVADRDNVISRQELLRGLLLIRISEEIAVGDVEDQFVLRADRPPRTHLADRSMRLVHQELLLVFREKTSGL
jgi:hypothetical protein